MNKDFDLDNLANIKIECWPYVTTLRLSKNKNVNLETLIKKFPNAEKVVLNSYAGLDSERLENNPTKFWPNLKVLNLQANSLRTFFKNKI